jgi:predicted ATPase
VAEKQMLLVMDNFEQVGDAAAALARLVRSTPGLVILATSRSPLRVPAEHEYDVPPLTVPDPNRRGELAALAQFEAVRLLVARARAVARGFELGETNRREIAEICVALDGLPLALELAGATLNAFSPAELLGRLEASLDALAPGPLDVPARQQTVRATIQWSYNLLGETEHELFARLAVFTGGWAVEAAREVCGATLESLRSLTEKGLVRAVGERFAMLTPIREFALERLAPDESSEVSRAHADYFAAYASAAQARAHVHGRDAVFLDTFARDYENFRTALRRTGELGETDHFARLAAAVGEYCYMRGPYGEARQWLEAAIADPPKDARLHALVARSLGMVSIEQGDYARATAAHERAASLFRSIGDADMEARSLANIGTAAIYLDEHDRARELFTAALERARTLDDEYRRDWQEQLVVNSLGHLEYLDGRLREAARWFERSLAICERIDDVEGAATATMNLGLVALRLGRLDDAESRLRGGLRLAEELQRPQPTAMCVLCLAAVAGRRGDLERSARLLGAADAMFEDYGVELDPYEREIRDEAVAVVEAAMGTEAADEAFARGRSQRRSDVLASALNEEA